MGAETGPLPALPTGPGQDWQAAAAAAACFGAACERATETAERTLRLLMATAAGRPGDAALRDLADAQRSVVYALITGGQHLAETGQAINRAAILAVVGPDLAPPARDLTAVPGGKAARRPARHRAAPDRRLRSVDPRNGVIPVAAFGALRATLRHAWTLHPVIPLATTAAAVVSGVTLIPPPQHVPPRWNPPAHAPASLQAAAAPAVSAGPVVTLTVPAPKGRHHRPAPVHAPAHAPVITAPAPEEPQPPSPPPPPAPGGALVIQQQQVLIGPGRTGQIVLFGQGGPVIWTAATTDPALTVSAAHGGIAAGGADVLTVTVDPAAMLRPGSAVVTVNGQPVTVTWG